jgi:hypothetical protein
MKVKVEYLDTKICFLGRDQIVRFIEPGLYPRMIKDGFDYMFEPLENKKKKDDTSKSDTE